MNLRDGRGHGNHGAGVTTNGVLRAAEVLELAAKAGLELAAAATLLDKESGGGRNVYGHDPVQTGGFYQKGGPVTKAHFAKYRAHRGQLGAQGVGQSSSPSRRSTTAPTHEGGATTGGSTP